MNNFKETYGPWAVVTGASSGIGVEFARELASKGLNLVMLARRKEKMDKLGKDLAADHGIEFRTASVDLSSPDFIDAVKEVTSDLDIGLLVSNAGAGQPGKFLSVPADELATMLQLNVFAQMELSHYFASRLVEAGRRGGILLVSSMAAFQGVPYIANYAAAKAYILNLGEALNRELKDAGIHVTVLVPGPTDTPMADGMDATMDNMPMTLMSPEQAALEGLLALEKNKAYHVPGRMNRLMSGFMGRRILTRNASVSMWGSLMKRVVSPQPA